MTKNISRTEVLLISVLVLFSFIIRVWELDPWYTTNDSYMYYSNANKIAEGRWSQVDLWVWPIGYSLVLSFFFMIFGASTTVACVISSVFGALTVGAVYVLGKQLFNREAGFLAAFMVAISPLHVYLSKTIMAEVPTMFFLVLSMVSLLKFLNSGRKAFLYSTSIFIALTSILRSDYLVIIPVLLFWVLFLRMEKSIKPIKFWDISLVVVIFILVYSPQLIYAYKKSGSFFPGYLTSQDQTKVSFSNLYTIGWLRPVPPFLLYPTHILFKYNILPPLLLIFYFIGAVKMFEKSRSNFLLIILFIFFFVFEHMMYAFQDASQRYSLPLVIPLSLLSSFGVRELCVAFFGKRYKVAILSFVLLYSTTLTHTYWLANDLLEIHGLAEDMYNWLNENTPQGAVILLSSDIADEHVKWSLNRTYFDLYGLDEVSAEGLIGKHDTYIVVSLYGNNFLENGLPLFVELNKNYKLQLIREEKRYLSSLFHWRSYSVSCYHVLK